MKPLRPFSCSCQSHWTVNKLYLSHIRTVIFRSNGIQKTLRASLVSRQPRPAPPTPQPPQNTTSTSAIVTTFAAMLAAYVTSEILTPNRPKSER
ncbi:hypothetical protein DSECCO2_143910 [anaerobic digester metagenome]